MTLSTGEAAGFPPLWGFPSSTYNYCEGAYDTGGMIWWGTDKATLEDVLEVANDPRYNGSIDRLTLCGTDDPAWTTQRDEQLANDPCYSQKYP